MHEDAWGQAAYTLRFAWGPYGATQSTATDGVLVVVDVLSFTTAVTVAVDRGMAVYPAPWRDARSVDLARTVDAVLAVGRHDVTTAHPWSLSPAALMAAPTADRLVLPSPNGSAISAAANGGTVVAASLRNADAVGQWLAASQEARPRPVTVVAAGERWPDGSLRPALEDLLGAGAVIAALTSYTTCHVSPEADAARVLFAATQSVSDAVRGCASGRELIDSGFGGDVEIAVEQNVSSAVPVLAQGAFRRAGATKRDDGQ